MKKLLLSVCIVILVIINCNCQTTNKIAIIPEPVSISLSQGNFLIDNNTGFCFKNTKQDDSKIKYISENLIRYFGVSPNNSTRKKISFIINRKENKEIGKEGYTLDVTSKGITINANTSAGLFYGYQTLFQLAPADIANTKYANIEIPCLQIVDYPRFEWRGAHLDVCRHFFDIDFVKKYIDILAMHKINKFHWHLTDDHGWRPEITKYPKLTEIGAWRVDRSNVEWEKGLPPQPGEKVTYGGFYTKQQMKDVVAYAAQRNIDVIPEIEMPGHSSAILAAYPEYSCENDEDQNYYVQIGPYWPPVAILCVGKDQTIHFIEDVLDEIMEIFPYEYIHIGGDEAFNSNWQRCPLCNQRMKDNNLKNYSELQSWFTKQIENYIIKHGKKMIGWDEILDGGVSPTSTIMSWRGSEGGIKAAKFGNDAIMTPNAFCYFDYYQNVPDSEPKAIGGYVPTSKVYQFDPTASMTPDEAKHIKGGQCNIWTEFIFTSGHVEYMLLPRLSALAEDVWSPLKNKSWDNFKQKIITQEKRYQSLGYKYCKANIDLPIQLNEKDKQ